MILVDANILIYAFNSDSLHHRVADRWLNARLSEDQRVGLPWPVLLAVLRVVTNPRAMTQPIAMSTARAQVRHWLESPAVWCPAPGDGHMQILDDLLALPGVQGNLVTDAHLAALAIEHGLEVCSADSDFARFPGVRWRNPLTD